LVTTETTTTTTTPSKCIQRLSLSHNYKRIYLWHLVPRDLLCKSVCVNESISKLSRLAFYSFDNVTTDAEGNYPASGTASPSYVSGWVDSAVSFDYSNNQYLSTLHIPLNYRSFTIDFWFYATNLSSGWDFSFGGQSEATSTGKCLFFNVHYQKLYFGFYALDTTGTINISTNQWYHTAFVYDNTTQIQSIYLNGMLDGNSTRTAL